VSDRSVGSAPFIKTCQVPRRVSSSNWREELLICGGDWTVFPIGHHPSSSGNSPSVGMAYKSGLTGFAGRRVGAGLVLWFKCMVT
jgi:hypothetical protein